MLNALVLSHHNQGSINVLACVTAFAAAAAVVQLRLVDSSSAQAAGEPLWILSEALVQ
jgi:hypothetical protein